MTGAQLAGWLRILAEQVESVDKVDGQTFRAGPIALPVAQSSTLRTWKQRHGSIDPPSVAADPSHEAIRGAVRDAFEAHGETLVGRIRDAIETLELRSVAFTSSQRSKELEVVEDTDRSSRTVESTSSTSSIPILGDTPRDANRSHRQPPRPRRDLMCTPMPARDWKPSEILLDYAMEWDLDARHVDQVLIELRDKYARQDHTIDWWDDRFCRFVEQRGKSGPRKVAPRVLEVAEDPVELAKIRDRIAAAENAAHDAEQQRLYDLREAAKA